MKDEIDVPFKIVPDALPLSCFVNCEKQAEREGGKVVLGWQVVQNYYFTSLIHHAVWEDAVGKLWDLTPIIMRFEGDNLTCMSGISVQFVADPTALPEGESPNRRSLPCKSIPKFDDPALVKAAEYLTRADNAAYAGDRAKNIYWQTRAETTVNQFAKRTNRPVVKYDLPPIPDSVCVGRESAADGPATLIPARPVAHELSLAL